MTREMETIKEGQISKAMLSIENRVRHVYNQGYEQGLEAGRKQTMTREQALKLLADARYADDLQGNNDLQTAHNMAIKALEQEPCEDAISRQAVLEEIDVKAWEFCDYLISKNRNDEQKPISHFADNLRECIREDLPSVKQQEPKTGHWKAKSFHELYCNNCGFNFDIMRNDFIDRMKYCPNCGAKMESEG